ncbi:MAG: amino acid permease [Gammaproteobacteria bacterium]|nr:amino acid permease [Gammaproteobacteria bacterium]
MFRGKFCGTLQQDRALTALGGRQITSLDNSGATLQRSVTLTQLALFGAGTILGAGIYVLTGKVAAEAGMYAPLAFMLAALIASLTAFSYAELSSRYPRSAGEAAYLLVAFGNPRLSKIAGWGIVLTGVVSAATLANGFVGYFQIFFDWPAWLLIILVISALGLLAMWGINASMNTAMTITLIEIGGLFMVIGVSGDALAELPQRWPELTPDLAADKWLGIATGAFLAFYAFIGFEDMVNVAEEVQQPKRTIPMAIALAIGLSTLLYVVVSATVVLSVPMSQLTQTTAPFALLMEQQGYSSTLISGISLIAIINGALVQIIMASRVMYGMADQGNAPAWLAAIHPVRRTPIAATLLATLAILLLAIAFPLVTLAKATSFIVLSVFVLVNLALIKIKLSQPADLNSFSCPLLVPILAALISVALLAFSTLS